MRTWQPRWRGRFRVSGSLSVTRHGERARMGRSASGGAGMTGGACGVLVPGVRVGTTEWERPARLKLAPDRTGRLMRPEAPGANGRSGRGGCRCSARVGAFAVPGAGVRGAAGPVGIRSGAGSGRAGRGDRAGPAAAGAVRGVRGVAGAAA